MFVDRTIYVKVYQVDDIPRITKVDTNMTTLSEVAVSAELQVISGSQLKQY